MLARAGVVIAIEEGALLGEDELGLSRARRLQLKGRERDGELVVVVVVGIFT